MNTITIEKEEFQELMNSIEELKQIVNEGFNSNKGNQINKQWLTKHEVCKLLRISERSLHTYRRNGEIPYTTIGSKIFYRVSDIKGLINNISKINHAKTD